MIPPSFDYHAPRTLREALGLLQQYGEEAKILSGGQSLLPLLKTRLASPGHVVDIGKIPGLDYIKEEGGFLRIGALVREAALERSSLIATRYPILKDTASVVADPLVRNLATVAGNLAHADPANDHPATMLALGAVLVAAGPAGEREIKVTDFFQGLFTTSLQANEILKEVKIPVPPAGSGGAYLKLERKVGDFATAGAAAFVVLSADRTIARAGIGLTNVAPTPVKATAAEAFLTGKRPEGAVLGEAGRLAASASAPSADRRGSVEYKQEMARVLTERALKKAVERAGGL